MNIGHHFISFLKGSVPLWNNRKFHSCFHFSFCHFTRRGIVKGDVGTRNAFLTSAVPLAGWIKNEFGFIHAIILSEASRYFAQSLHNRLAAFCSIYRLSFYRNCLRRGVSHTQHARAILPGNAAIQVQALNKTIHGHIFSDCRRRVV
ncbi:MAG: hypothetical protein ABSF34_12275 [Verrucomicrobiota bacterium]